MTAFRSWVGAPRRWCSRPRRRAEPMATPFGSWSSGERAALGDFLRARGREGNGSWETVAAAPRPII